MSAPIASKLDGMQVLQHAFEDSTGRIRVDSAASIAITGVVEVAIDYTTDSIAIGTSGQLFTGTASGGKFGLDVNLLNPVTGVSVTGTIDTNVLNPVTAVTILNPVTSVSLNSPVSATILNPVTSVSVSNFPTTQAVSGSVSATVLNPTTAVSILNPVTSLNINNFPATQGVSGSVSATILNPVTSLSVNNFPAVQAVSGNVAVTGLVALQEPVMIEGSLDGTTAGTKYGYVYNLRQQILAAHDRLQHLTYADFGTPNQRITQVDYTSVTFPGVTARKTLVYTLVGTRYRRDDINWSLV